MDKYYLTENIFLTEKEMFCEKNNKIKKINTRDWHLSLYEYGWNKLPLQWNLSPFLNQELLKISQNMMNLQPSLNISIM